jgi:hypothetical protein
VDTTTRGFALRPAADSTQTFPFTYARADTTRLSLAGTIKGDSVRVDLKRLDLNSFLLLGRGFHWINERPFNR